MTSKIIGLAMRFFGILLIVMQAGSFANGTMANVPPNISGAIAYRLGAVLPGIIGIILVFLSGRLMNKDK